MFIEINKIPHDGLHFDEVLTLADLEGLAGERIVVPRSRMTGTVTREGRRADLEARLDAAVELTCSRCIERFRASVSTDFFLTLVPGSEAPPSGEAEVVVDDDDVSSYSCVEGRADLEAIATEQMYLNLPLKPVCREGCRGLCPACGANRNRTECGCRQEETDPRLAPLLQFKNRTPGS